MIFTQFQAAEVYAAVAHLNNISANRGVQVAFVGTASRNEGDLVRLGFREEADGEITVYVGPGILGRERETYPNQAAFAAAYNLN